MIILHGISSLNIGGAETALYRLIKNDKSNFHHIITLSKNGYYKNHLSYFNNVKIYEVDLKKIHKIFINIYIIIKIIRSIKPDIIQTWLYHSDFLIGIIAKLLGHKKIYWNIRNAKLKFKYNSLSLNFLIIFNAFLSYFVPKKIIVNSTAGIKYHQKLYYSNKKIIKISNGFEFDYMNEDDNLRNQFRKIHSIGNNTLLIGMVSRWHKQKNFEMLFKSLKLLEIQYTDWQLILVGENINRQNKVLCSQLNSYNILEKTILHPVTNNLNKVYNAIDIHVSTSHGEGFPNVVLESVSFNKISLSTNTGDSEEILKKNIFLFEYNDHKSLYEKLLFFKNKKNYEKIKNDLVIPISNKNRIKYSILNMVNEYNKLWRIS